MLVVFLGQAPSLEYPLIGMVIQITNAKVKNGSRSQFFFLLLNGKYNTVSDTLIGYSSCRIDTDPLVTYFLFGIFWDFSKGCKPSKYQSSFCSSYFNWSHLLQY